jgi:hypothetical protein
MDTARKLAIERAASTAFCLLGAPRISFDFLERQESTHLKRNGVLLFGLVMDLVADPTRASPFLLLRVTSRHCSLMGMGVGRQDGGELICKMLAMAPQRIGEGQLSGFQRAGV